jgi:AAA15 family ATPase/GTPase
MRVFDGDITPGKVQGTYVFTQRGTDGAIPLPSLSSGLKSFAIIALLLRNGSIENNGLIILDEPEIHLHPEWQVLFAKIIVLLQMEFGLHILLTSHSPYFIHAIDTFSRQYNIYGRCKYYFADVDHRGIACMSDVTGDMEQVYRTLYRPLQELENIRGSL